MSWNSAILEIIDLQTFASIWYWLAVAVTWAVVSHWILGIPFDVIYRARRSGDAGLDDLEALMQVHVRRFIMIDDLVGPWGVGLSAFVLSGLAMLGFYYQVEFAQGLFVLGLPLTLVGALCTRACRKFDQTPPKREKLVQELMRLRIIIQAIAMVSIFFTAMYGMYFNLSTPLGF